MNVSENAACPCGSGEIYVQCCQGQVEWVLRKGQRQPEWKWLHPEVQQTLALAGSLRQTNSEVLPTVAEISAGAAFINQGLKDGEGEDEYGPVVSLMADFSALVLESAAFDPACDLIPREWLEELLAELMEEFRRREKVLDKALGRTVIQEVFDRWSILPLEEVNQTDLLWALAVALRRQRFTSKGLAAILMAMNTLATHPLDQLIWHFVFRGAVTRQVQLELLTGD